MDGFQVALIIVISLCLLAAIWFVAPILVGFGILVYGALTAV